MFITNIDSLRKTELYRCDYGKSIILQKSGFSLLSIDGDDYIFVLTDKLKDFLKGGEMSGDTSKI